MFFLVHLDLPGLAGLVLAHLQQRKQSRGKKKRENYQGNANKWGPISAKAKGPLNFEIPLNLDDKAKQEWSTIQN